MQHRANRIGATTAQQSVNPEFEEDDDDAGDEAQEDPDTSLLADAMLTRQPTPGRGMRGRSIITTPNYYVLSKAVVWVGAVTQLILFALLFAGLFIAASWYFRAQTVYLADRPVITTFNDIGTEGSVGPGDTNANKTLGCETIASFRVVNYAPNDTNIGLTDRRGYPSLSGCVKRDSSGTLNIDELAFYLNTTTGGQPVTGLYQAPNGYIGILTTNPVYPLDVNGTAKIRGALIMGVNSTIDFIDPSRIRSSVRGMELAALSNSGVEIVGFTVRPDGSTLAVNLTVMALTVVNSLSITTISVAVLQSTNGQFNGTLGVGNLTTLSGGLLVSSGVAVLTGSVTISAGSLNAVGSLSATANITSGQWANLNSLIVANNAQIGGSLQVAGNANFLTGMTVAQNLTIGGTLIASSFSFTQGLTISQSINGSLTVSGSITGGNGLSITSGAVSFAGVATFSSAASFAGNVTVPNLFGTTGTFSDFVRANRLNSTGISTLGSLAVTGAATIGGSLIVQGAVIGASTVGISNSLSGSTTVFNMDTSDGANRILFSAFGSGTFQGALSAGTTMSAGTTLTVGGGTIVAIGSTASLNIGNTGVAGDLHLFNTVPTETITLDAVTGNVAALSLSAPIVVIGGGSQVGSRALTVNGAGTGVSIAGGVSMLSTLNVVGVTVIGAPFQITTALSGGTTVFKVTTSSADNILFNAAGSASFAGDIDAGTITAITGLVVAGGAAPASVLSVTGKSTFTGDIAGTGTFSYVSDRLVKTNITDMDNATALSVVMGIHPRTYRLISDFDPKQPANLTRAGFIAEEVDANTQGFYKIVTPNAFTLNISGVPTSLMGLSKDDMIPFLWRAVQILIDRTNKCGCTST